MLVCDFLLGSLAGLPLCGAKYITEPKVSSFVWKYMYDPPDHINFVQKD